MNTQPTWKLCNTTLQISNATESLKFYSFLGMSTISQTTIPAGTTYHLAFPTFIPGSHYTSNQSILTLQHTPTSLLPIHSGNSNPKGYGHICISVDNIQAACARLEASGTKFQKRLSDGRMNFIAFALDPDGYWVELIARAPLPETAHLTTTDTSSYRIAHTMLRVKDPVPTLAFYRDVMGMELLREAQHPAAGFGVYFLGYPKWSEKYVPEHIPEGVPGMAKPVFMEGLLELTWNYGTEKEEGGVYWSGEGEGTRGFVSVGVSVGDLGGTAEYLVGKGWECEKMVGEGEGLRVRDPDGYVVEVLQDEGVLAN